jgi:hypothetical protein
LILDYDRKNNPPDTDPVWLGLYQDARGPNAFMIRYFNHNKADGTYLPWGGPRKINRKDAVLGVVNQLPQGQVEVRAFFDSVLAKHPELRRN